MIDPPKLTRNQSLVLDVLKSNPGPLGAYEILDILGDTGLRAPVQIYRALDRLLVYGMVHRLAARNAYIACRHDILQHSATSVMAICKQCHYVFEFDDRELDKKLEATACSFDFQRDHRPNATTIEMHGICFRCNKNQDEQHG